MKRLIILIGLLAATVFLATSAHASCWEYLHHASPTASNNAVVANPTHRWRVSPEYPYYNVWACDAVIETGCTDDQRYTSTGTCPVTAVTCTYPQYPNAGSTACLTEPTCSAGQYPNASHVCEAIPNCNATSAQDGKFYNVATRQCETQTANITMCISGGSGSDQKYYCPPEDDCKPGSYVCTNSTAVVTDAQTSRAAQIAAAKAAADIKNSQAAASSASAQASSTAKQTAKDAAKSKSDTAKIVSDQAATNPLTPLDQVAQAAKAYQQAMTDYAQQAAKAANSVLAASASQTAAGLAYQYDGAITTDNPGNAQSHQALTSDQAQKAQIAADDAASGLGSGTGTGQGTSSTTCVQTGTCAQDASTQQGQANEKLDAIKDRLTKDPFTQTSPTAARTISASNEAVKAAFSSRMPSITISDTVPDCPVFQAQIPFLNTVMRFDQFCTMDSLIRPTLNVLSMIAWSIVTLTIVMGA